MTRVTGPWLDHPGTQKVLTLLDASGAQALLVGGCVRNALMGRDVGDIDIATDAHPANVMQTAAAAGLKAIPTGIDHGTVTVVAERHRFEITTFRRDVKTDGRHAVVHFADTVDEDAARRDFTMNALYARRDGTVVDPLGGIGDLRAWRVRFIGTPSDRIREDYLRSLRYFRFHALYGDPGSGFDAEALDGIASNLDGISTLSRERIGAEMTKLLGAADPAPSVAGMRQVGVLPLVLPGANDTGLAPLIHLEAIANRPPDSLRRLAALAGAPGENAAAELRLSRADQRALALLRDGVESTAPPAELAYLYGFGPAWDITLLRAALSSSDLPPDAADRIAQGAAARFPITAADLMPQYTGFALGNRLRDLERRWIASGFAMDKSALMAL